MDSLALVTITTDFGVADAYVGVMKGVILGIAPGTVLVDISHDVPPQDVLGGALLLASIVRFFPPHTIHLAVVDPGVGTDRRPIAVRTDRATFVGPDNGLFVPALAELHAIDAETGVLGEGARAVQLERDEFRIHPVSGTFHGRDIFAPAAAHLSAGVPLPSFGQELGALTPLASPKPSAVGNTVRGRIIAIDHFGNAISNIPGDLVPPDPVIAVKGAMVRGLSRTYQDAEIVALLGSAGVLELGVRNGSAAERFGIRRGDEIVVRGER